MVEQHAARRTPLVPTSPGLRLLPAASRHILRGAAKVRLAAQRAFGVALPESACRAASQGERAALWLGPDEWLLIAPEHSGAETASALAAALAQLPHSLVDVSHRQIALELSGPRAALLLAAGCPLDLEASAFPVGMCTRTVLGKTDIVLWRTAADAFRIEVWRSFAPYLSGFLEEAARGVD
ncbi:MAG TPA: sarcosine oxidase subunit gamma family protein [Steroidobacteraceae bacterium]|jgi:sarcosine oxidase subunit gamma|nr:sarcosine oxidase subunit gamma family protein [Steroidobacteraceae bacterium]